MLSNAYFLAKFRFDTAENEPAKNLPNFRKNRRNQYRSGGATARRFRRQQGAGGDLCSDEGAEDVGTVVRESNSVQGRVPGYVFSNSELERIFLTFIFLLVFYNLKF